MVSWRSISAFNWIPSMEFFSPLFRQLPNFSGDSSPRQRVPDILNPIKNGQEHSKLIKANPCRRCPGTKSRFMETNKWDVIPGKESLAAFPEAARAVSKWMCKSVYQESKSFSLGTESVAGPTSAKAWIALFPSMESILFPPGSKLSPHPSGCIWQSWRSGRCL